MNIKTLFPVFFVVLLLGIIGIGYAYFFVVSPGFVEKPEIEKPAIEKEFTEDHVYYFMNELDGYKLHKNPLNNEPAVVEFDFGSEDLLIEIQDNEFEATTKANPDIRIYMSKELMLDILRSSNFEKTLIDLYNSGEIRIEIVSDESTLALKGFKSLYDKLSSNEITGNLVKLNPRETIKGINLSVLLFVAAILKLILEKI